MRVDINSLSVMAFTAFLLVSILQLALLGTGSGQLTILHSYPELGNFSYVELACVVTDSGPSYSVATGATFQLNGTDLGEEEIAETLDNGTVRLLLAQKKEGFFTCVQNRSVSSNSVGLAAGPSISSSPDPIVHKVELPDSDTEVSIVLECDINPGALVQRYSVQWVQLAPKYTVYNSSMFNFTLSVNGSIEVLRYQCEVTVHHDGTISSTFSGTHFIVEVTVQGKNKQNNIDTTTAGVVGATFIVTFLCFITVSCSCVIGRLRQKYRYRSIVVFNSMTVSEPYLYCPSTMITLEDGNVSFMSPGKTYVDENDFRLHIPEGAVPGRVTVPSISVEVTLFGSFQFPEGLRPVSPLFWVCVHDNNFQFSKPVEVTIPHFLDLEKDEDIQSLGLTFLKANHNKNSEGLYEFQPTDGEMIFEPFYGVLTCTHFCYLCIAANDMPMPLKRTQFCITAVLPRSSTQMGKSVKSFFFVTFFNHKTCIKKVDMLIKKLGLEDYEINKVPFKFRTKHKDPALEMILTQPQHGQIGVKGKKKIFRSDVDFFAKVKLSEEELECLQSDEFYPPRFEVFFASFQENATLSGGKITFRGAATDIEFDVHLDLPSPITSISSFAVPWPKVSSRSIQQLFVSDTEHQLVDPKKPLNIDRDVPNTKRNLQHLNKQELKTLFQELGLFHSTVQDNFSHSSRDDYAEDLIRSWILGRDAVRISEKYRGGATNENLKKALMNINHLGVAETIV